MREGGPAESGEVPGDKGVPLPLDGVTVLDLTQFAAGPYTAMLLGDAGARVIKIEPPGGEPYRHEGTPLATGPDGSRVGSYILRFGRDKESVVLDLKDPAGIAALRALVQQADVLVQNFKPATAARLGIDYATLRQVNPRLVYASVTGFGQPDFLPSPYSNSPAFAVVSEAMGGVMGRFGDEHCEPHWSNVSLGDLFPGGLAVAGVVMALLQRDRTGEGQLVDLALTDGMTSLNEKAVALFSTTGYEPPRGEDDDDSSVVVRAADAWVLVVLSTDDDVGRVCELAGAPSAADGLPAVTLPGRHRAIANRVAPAVQAWARERDFATVCADARRCGITVVKVNTVRDIVESEHARARQMLLDVDYGPYGSHPVVGSPIKFGGAAARTRARVHLVGEDTDQVLRQPAAHQDEARSTGG